MVLVCGGCMTLTAWCALCCGRELGFFGCLGKPFSAGGLMRFIEAIQRGELEWLSVTTS